MARVTPGIPDQCGAAESGAAIARECRELRQAADRGALGRKIAAIVLRHSPADILRMKRNFGKKIQDLPPEYRDPLADKINEHLLGTWEAVRIRYQQDSFSTMKEPVKPAQRSYWDMVLDQCTGSGGGEPRIRFLRYLLAAFCMFVLEEPGHAPGTPFPGGDTVQVIDGIFYCPVRDKAGDVDAALCPFCPALQTPATGYLRPPVNASRHRKQEFIENCYRFHNFNG